MSSTPQSKQVYRVNIFNQTYSIASSTSAEEFQHIADQVDNLMRTIASRTGTSDGARVGVLAAMHLADHLHLAQQRLAEKEAELERLQAQIGRHTGRLDSLLESALAEATEPAAAVPQAAPHESQATPSEPADAGDEPATLFPIGDWRHKAHGAGA